RATNSPKSSSAGGQELQPWLVNSSTTPSGFFASSAELRPQNTEKASVAAASPRREPLSMVLPLATPVFPPPFCLKRKMADTVLKGKSRKIESSGKYKDFRKTESPVAGLRRRGSSGRFGRLFQLKRRGRAARTAGCRRS